ncbi:hypothetical protein [Salinispora arenicola]|uniref:hypothetical protein n=1 Tax=Salinispora arenicola TaxID=168697 RepID=UPI0003A6569B|nr:hypothetical protein [Salinispora arenicola]
MSWPLPLPDLRPATLAQFVRVTGIRWSVAIDAARRTRPVCKESDMSVNGKVVQSVEVLP